MTANIIIQLLHFEHHCLHIYYIWYQRAQWCGICLAADLHIVKSCHKIQNTVDLETSVCLGFSSTVQHLSYLCIVQLWWPTCQCEQTWNCPLLCMMAVDILLLLNTCTHLATFQHSRAKSLNASCSSACHSCRFTSGELLLSHNNTVLLQRLPFLNEKSVRNVCALLYTYTQPLF